VKRVVVLGLMGQYPMGGMAWQVLHHVLGFRRLGCECFYVENSGAPPYSPRLRSIVADARENLRFLRDTFRRFDLSDAWAYYDCLTSRWAGLGEARVRDLLEHADVIVNLCGATRPESHAARKGCLVYLETDPILEQVKLASGDPRSRAFVDAHDLHFTYGWNVGEPGCPVPSGGIAWRKTHPPVLVDLWEGARAPARARWRTIATWRNVGKDVTLGGETYLWSKHPSFERVMDLPSRTREPLEIALVATEEAVRERFLAAGWALADPWLATRSAAAHRRYIRGARGEFSVEKDDQVRLRSGWFSDRSVCFLAAGRPCVLQDTGFGTRLPTEEGLLAWSTAEQAADALERVARDYSRHRAAALRIAREFFDASVLLPPILEAAGA
jgi:hypothetical protein